MEYLPQSLSQSTRLVIYCLGAYFINSVFLQYKPPVLKLEAPLYGLLLIVGLRVAAKFLTFSVNNRANLFCRGDSNETLA